MTNHDATATDQNQLTSGSKPATTDSQFTRREVLVGMAAGVAMALPTIVPARVLGRDGAVAPSEKINLGVIGIGPRCTYVLTSMLGLPDVRCVAITDVQKSRRDAGKALVDKLAGNSDCVLDRDMREMLARKDIDAVIVATGDDGIEIKIRGIAASTEKIKKTRGIDAQIHARNFFDCVKSRKPTITNPDVMMHSHIASFAASFSWILGRKLTFDPAKNEFVGDAEANSLRSRPERNCWA